MKNIIVVDIQKGFVCDIFKKNLKEYALTIISRQFGEDSII